MSKSKDIYLEQKEHEHSKEEKDLQEMWKRSLYMGKGDVQEVFQSYNEKKNHYDKSKIC
jgi:hypothetical protein